MRGPEPKAAPGGVDGEEQAPLVSLWHLIMHIWETITGAWKRRCKHGVPEELSIGTCVWADDEYPALDRPNFQTLHDEYPALDRPNFQTLHDEYPALDRPNFQTLHNAQTHRAKV
jgi:hypothetical protein